MPKTPRGRLIKPISSQRALLYGVFIVAVAFLPLILVYGLGLGGIFRSAVLPITILLTFVLIIVVSLRHIAPGALLHDYGWRLGAAFAVIALLAVFAFVMDYRMRVTTLFETFVEGSVGVAPGTDVPVREVTFEVEHPGVEHRLFVSPMTGGGVSANFVATVRVQLLDREGAVLLDVEEAFEPRSADRRSLRTEWNGVTYTFTPRQAGPYTLLVMPITVDIPEIHVRIEDPAKRDGDRPPGY